MHYPSRAVRALCAISVAAVTATGCNSGSQLSGAAKETDDAKAIGFLKHSMDVYSAMPAFTADCSLSVTGAGAETRTVSYAKPNRFKVVSTSANGMVQTSICDGAALLEFDNKTGQPPRQGPAPDTIAEVSTIQMRHPMYCGTLLYQFFGGSGNYSGLVDREKGLVTFGPEEKSSTGEPAHTVNFYAQQQYGHVEALIGENTGYVFRIKYDSEPLMKMMRDPETQKRAKAQAEAALSSAKDSKTKAEAITALSNLSSKSGMAFLSEETYSRLTVPATLSNATFALIPPKGTTPVEFGVHRMTSPKPPVR